MTATLAVALLTTGCSAGPSGAGGAGAGSGVGSGAAASSAAATPTPEPSGSASLRSGVIPGDLGDPVASREATSEGTGARLDVYAPRRGDHGVELTVRLTFTKAPADDRVLDSSMLSASSAMDEGAGTPNGIRLLDKEHGKLYLPAVAPDGSWLCSPNVLSLAEVGDQVYASCLFATPSSGTVTVMTPTFGAFPDVPLR